MSEKTEIIFLGVNDAGMRVYQWLCSIDDTRVRALITTKEQLSLVEDIGPDYVVSCGFSYVIPEDILDIPSEGCVNLHPAYLPFNRGANPNIWSIVEGTPTGVTLHYMDEGIDTGDIIARREVDTHFTDTGKSLHVRLEDAQVELFKETWPRLVSGDVAPIEQDAEEGTYHRTSDFDELCKLTADHEMTVKELLDRLRALTYPPYDNAEIEVDGETYTVEVDIQRK